jgi:hypothetical protein
MFMLILSFFTHLFALVNIFLFIQIYSRQVTVFFVLISHIIFVCVLLGSLWWQLYSRLSYSCRSFVYFYYICLFECDLVEVRSPFPQPRTLRLYNYLHQIQKSVSQKLEQTSRVSSSHENR